MSDPLVTVDGLTVSFRTEGGTVRAVDGVSFELRAGEVLAIVGESGAGKSAMALSLMGLTRGPNTTVGGSARLGETELLAASEATLRRVRGGRIALIPQDPLSSLNPVQRVGDQVAEQVRAHGRASRQDARARAVTALAGAGVPQAEERARAYPHELSGGMRQRVMIAMALSCDPEVLIADEPTTALDVTIQAQVLDLLRDLRARRSGGVLLVTHDLGVVAAVADRVAVMYGGRIVETGTLEQIFYDPRHPYTWGLLGSIARLDTPRAERLPAIAGTPPSPLDLPAGCHFRPRCPHRHDACDAPPALAARGAAGDHEDRCFLAPADKRSLRVVRGRIGLEAGVVA